MQNVYIEAKTLRRIEKEMFLQKVGSVYSWTEEAFIRQLFTQLLCDDLDRHQNIKMIFASLLCIFPSNHVTSSNRSKARVHVCVSTRACMCVCCSVC